MHGQTICEIINTTGIIYMIEIAQISAHAGSEEGFRARTGPNRGIGVEHHEQTDEQGLLVQVRQVISDSAFFSAGNYPQSSRY